MPAQRRYTQINHYLRCNQQRNREQEAGMGDKMEEERDFDPIPPSEVLHRSQDQDRKPCEQEEKDDSSDGIVSIRLDEPEAAQQSKQRATIDQREAIFPQGVFSH